MKESSKYRFLYNSPAFTEGRSKGKHRKFHFDTCLLKPFSFSQFVFVVMRKGAAENKHSQQGSLAAGLLFCSLMSLVPWSNSFSKSATKAQIPKGKQVPSHCSGALCSKNGVCCLLNTSGCPFPIWLNSHTRSFWVQSMNIYCTPQEIFLQVSKAFKTLENQWMNADAMLQAIHRVTVKKHFANVLLNKIHKACWTQILNIAIASKLCKTTVIISSNT